jgi:hypothetical protein
LGIFTRNKKAVRIGSTASVYTMGWILLGDPGRTQCDPAGHLTVSSKLHSIYLRTIKNSLVFARLFSMTPAGFEPATNGLRVEEDNF